MKIAGNDKYIFYIIASFLFVYLIVRSNTLSITHDEVGTFLNYGKVDLWTCFWNEVCWKNANNHLLNTFLIQISVYLFGVEEWSLRLPNVLSSLLYFYFAIKIVRKYSSHFWLSFLGFSLLCFNPFLLDFFGLARGYGLSMAFLLPGLYYLMKFIKTGTTKDQISCILFLVLSIFSNFTVLIVYIALLIVIFINQVLKFLQNEISRGQFFRSQGISLLTTLILFVFLYYPISLLSQKGEFLWGTDSFSEMFKDLTRNELYGERYLGKQSSIFYYYISVLLVLGSMFLVIFRNWKNQRKYFLKGSQISMVLVFLLVCFGLILQTQFLESTYLLGRKGILFIPICSLLVYFGFSVLMEGQKKWINYTIIMISFMTSYHFFKTMNFDQCREWNYDKNTLTVIERVKEASTQMPKPVNLGVHWLFHPSSEFYRLYEFDFYALGPYLKQADMESNYDFFYMHKDENHLIADQYELLEEYDTGYLYRLKK